jgi:hypothetical protein
MRALSAEEALRFTRLVDERLPAARLTPSAGNIPIALGSIAAVEAFLEPVDVEENLARGMQGSISYLEPKSLPAWVRDVIGDAELAGRLDAVVETERAFGLMVPEIKQLLVDRLTECRTVLEPAGAEGAKAAS